MVDTSLKMTYYARMILSLEVPPEYKKYISDTTWSKLSNETREDLVRYGIDFAGLLSKAAEELHDYLDELITKSEISYLETQVRPKSIGSYIKKALRRIDEHDPDSDFKYNNPKKQIEDTIGARILFYSEAEQKRFESIIINDSDLNKLKDLVHHDKSSGYVSTHIILRNVDKNNPNEPRLLYLRKFLETYPGLELQLRTVAAHAWAEYEHDIQYKPDSDGGKWGLLPEKSKEKIKQLFIEASGLRKYMDRTFTEIQKIIEQAERDANSPKEEATHNTSPSSIKIQELKSIIDSQLVPTPYGLEFSTNDRLTQLTSNISAFIDTNNESEHNIIKAIGDTWQHDGKIEKRISHIVNEESPTLEQFINDLLLLTFKDEYAESAPSKHERMVQKLRLNWLDFRMRVYALTTKNGQQYKFLTNNMTLRKLAEEVAKQKGIEASALTLHKDQIIAPSPQELRNSYTPIEITATQTIYVAKSIDRHSAEEACKILWNRFDNDGFRIYRAGGVFLGEPDQSTILIPEFE